MKGMYWVYLLIILVIIAMALYLRVRGIKTVRFFGCEVLFCLVCLLFLTLFIGEILLPMPQYTIQHQVIPSGYNRSEAFSLNKILEDEAHKSGIRFDPGSFQIIDSHGMSLNHLFLCSYQTDGNEEVRVFQFEKNVFGDMKPKYPFSHAAFITKDSSDNAFYRAYVEDGIFGGYLVTAGYASDGTVLSNYQSDGFTMGEIHPSGYFLWAELVRQPWKAMLLQTVLVTITICVVGKLCYPNRKPITVFSKWKKGDPVFECVKEENSAQA